MRVDKHKVLLVIACAEIIDNLYLWYRIARNDRPRLPAKTNLRGKCKLAMEAVLFCVTTLWFQTIFTSYCFETVGSILQTRKGSVRTLWPRSRILYESRFDQRNAQMAEK